MGKQTNRIFSPELIKCIIDSTGKDSKKKKNKKEFRDKKMTMKRDTNLKEFCTAEHFSVDASNF